MYRRRTSLRVRAAAAALIAAVLLAAVWFGSSIAGRNEQWLRLRLGQKNYKVQGEEGPQYYEAEYSDPAKLRADAEEVSRRIAEEGIVLLRNEENVLPLRGRARVSVFGGFDDDGLKDALESEELEVNADLWSFDRRKGGSSFPQKLESSFGDYPDAAIVVVRSGSTEEEIRPLLDIVCEHFENVVAVLDTDCPPDLKLIREYGIKGCLWTGSGIKETQSKADEAQIPAREKALAEILSGSVNPSGRLPDTWVYDRSSAPAAVNSGDCRISNSKTAKGGSYLAYSEGLYVGYRYYETRYEDAVSGNGGSSGGADKSTGGKADKGAENSADGSAGGKADKSAEKAADSNAGDAADSNAGNAADSSRDAGAESSTGNSADSGEGSTVSSAEAGTGVGPEAVFRYEDTVAYPFGYGLSYTSFTLGGMHVEFVKGNYTVTVDVTNTGSTAGKEVVQVYLQKPYTTFDSTNGIEVPSVILVGFAKTDLLQPGGSQTVTISVGSEWKKTFDAAVHGTYIVEAGTYYFTAAQNAHEAVANIMRYKASAPQDTAGSGAAAKQASGQTGTASAALKRGNAALVSPVVQKDTDFNTYTAAADTEETVRLRFKDANPATWKDGYTPLSRKDWAGTWPVLFEGGSWNAPSGFLEALHVTSGEDASAPAPVYNSPHGDRNTNLIRLRGVEDDDYRWNSLLDQLSWRETYSLVRKGGGLLNEVVSCSLPQSIVADYANGLSASYGGEAAVKYPSAPILAATWNEELIEEMASVIGEEALAAGVTIWKIPSLDIHRTAFSDNCGDSFSEDSFLTGKMAAAICRGVSSKGVIPALGRFAISRQQSDQEGTCILTGEQALRELYLEGFRLALKEGGKGRKAVIAGMNRIGPRWCGGSSGLLTGVLRSEWGFNGFVMTDVITDGAEGYCDILEGLEAGTDVWQNTSSARYSVRGAQLTYGVRARFRTAAGRVLKSLLYSNAMNGMGEETTLSYSTAPWKYWRMAIDAVLMVLTFLCGWYALAQFLRARRLSAKISELERERKRKERQRRSGTAK